MHKKEKSQALIISLWILAILTILAVSIGRQVSMALYLSKYQKNRLKAISLAKAGINRAIVELERDAKENAYDSLVETWSTGKDIQGNYIFQNVEIEEGIGETFTVTITDEERKIDINKIDDFGQKQLAELFLFAGSTEAEAGDLKNIIVAWINPAAETEPDREIFRNGPLGIPEELLLILEYYYEPRVDVENCRKKAHEVYDKVKDLIAVYTEGKINLNTVSAEVFNNILIPAVSENDPTSLVAKIVQFREANGIFDEENIDSIKSKFSSLTPEEENIITQLFANNLITIKSNYFRIESVGNVGNITKNITAIYDRGTKKTAYWHEN